MAVIAGTLTGKVLIQIGESEPVEVGTIEIPLHLGPSGFERRTPDSVIAWTHGG